VTPKPTDRPTPVPPAKPTPTDPRTTPSPTANTTPKPADQPAPTPQATPDPTDKRTPAPTDKPMPTDHSTPVPTDKPPVQKPKVTNPSVTLRAGSKARHPAVVVTARVTPSDAEIAAYDLQLSNNGEAWAPRAVSAGKVHVTGAGTTQMLTKLPISNEIRFRIKANTPAGRASRWAASDAFNVCLYEETHASVRFSGTLQSEALPGSSGGTVKWASSGASARFKFTGSSVGFVSSYGPDRGKVTLKIDGVKVGRVNLYAPRVRAGRVVWATSVSPGTHVLKVQIKGKHSSKSVGSRVDVDGFITSAFTR